MKYFLMVKNQLIEPGWEDSMYKHYKNLIEENTILVLTDKSDEDKLLGMTKDIAYDK